MCNPWSLRSVLQHPSLYQPVRGLVEQVSNTPPRTLNEGSMDDTKDFSRLNDGLLGNMNSHYIIAEYRQIAISVGKITIGGVGMCSR